MTSDPDVYATRIHVLKKERNLLQQKDNRTATKPIWKCQLRIKKERNKAIRLGLRNPRKKNNIQTLLSKKE